MKSLEEKSLEESSAALAVQVNDAAKYTWRKIVATERPSSQTPRQQGRLESLAKLTAALHKWALSQKLNPKRVDVCAYIACVFTVAPTPFTEALLGAKYSLWLYNLDDHLDQLDYSTASNPQDLTACMDLWDAQVSYILRPLYEAGVLTLEQAAVVGADRYLQLPVAELSPAQTPSLVLANSFLVLYNEIKEAWLAAHTESAKVWRTLTRFNDELVYMLKRVRQEVVTSLNFKFSRNKLSLPDLEEYLEGSKYTIAVRVVAVIINGFESNPDETWRLCLPALNSCARIGRLINDLGGYWKELLVEQKINSVAVALAHLDYEPIAAYNNDSPEVAKAVEIVIARLQREIEYIGQLVDTPLVETSSLMYHARVQTAFLLAMYEKGDFVVPTETSSA